MKTWQSRRCSESLIKCRSGADLLNEDIHYEKDLIMKAQDFRDMSPDELDGKLEELQRHLFDLRSQAVTETLENSKIVTNVKRDIARLKTVMRESEKA